ncbi:acyl-CoA/acyl-ACP dehydrogenase [Sphaerisporangium sp. TRM90804]|uniref:acyl-CoA dehydrogenase family protein n=1 Tax=Sphaerisporangium sp. TRM90804 TaxID=3031113 RepID=UPI00244780B1|nr:acyl-CoA/acyl-ACP dehydrogenase [Sphaerisporangium sp. TRM90804]MDH2427441.1 acyl-CoA/acyl-ACP dehydrogenase [Sphaerisporangium sp. TRM90804]
MTLLYSEVEEELRAAVRGLLADRHPPATVIARVEAASPYDADLWKTLARDIGVAGLLVPEELDGAGATAREAAVVLEELGRAVTPVPFLTSSVLATQALVAAATDAAAPLLTALATGQTTAALAVSFATSPYVFPATGAPGTAAGGAVTAGTAGGAASAGTAGEAVTVGADGTLSGRVRAVAGADVADVLIVPASGALYAVDAADAAVNPLVSLDMTRPVADVTFTAAPARRVAEDLEPLRTALRYGAGLLASEQLGVAEWCLTTTVAYVKERRQFARPVGSFQALKHRLADLWMEIVQARAAARNAADALATGTDTDTAVAIAQAWCGTVAVHAAEECVQLHGGIGMTWEHPAHLYLKRAKADEIALGTPAAHRTSLATPAGLPSPPA